MDLSNIVPIGFDTGHSVIVISPLGMRTELLSPFLSHIRNGVKPLSTNATVRLTSTKAIPQMTLDEYYALVKLLDIPYLMEVELSDDGYLMVKIPVKYDEKIDDLIIPTVEEALDNHRKAFRNLNVYRNFTSDSETTDRDTENARWSTLISNLSNTAFSKLHDPIEEDDE